jgi:hypothetical protein
MRLISITKISDHLPLQPCTFYRYARQGIYPQIFKRFGGKLLVDLDEVEKILNGGAETGKREHANNTQGGATING